MEPDELADELKLGAEYNSASRLAFISLIVAILVIPMIFFPPGAVVAAIIAFVLSGRARSLERIDPVAKKAANSARTIAIIALILTVLFALLFIGFFLLNLAVLPQVGPVNVEGMPTNPGQAPWTTD